MIFTIKATYESLQLLENKVVDCLFLEHSMFEHENVDEFIFKLYRFFYIVIIFFKLKSIETKLMQYFFVMVENYETREGLLFFPHFYYIIFSSFLEN